jgi:hypothetical protein
MGTVVSNDQKRIAELEAALADARHDRIYWQQLATSRGRLLAARVDELAHWRGRAERAEAKDRHRAPTA